jgi:hypothetical protein
MKLHLCISIHKAYQVVFVLVVLFSNASTTHASFITQDLSAPGDGLLTLDTETGLKWLDFQVTKNLSIDEINAGVGQWSTSFRYATYDEGGTLLDDAGLGGTEGFNFYPEKLDAAVNFIHYFGNSDASNFVGAAFDRPDVCRTCRFPPWAFYLVVGVNQWGEGMAHIYDQAWYESRGYGNALIQISSSDDIPESPAVVVPVPATIPLLSIGLGAFFWARVKKGV